MTDKETYTPGHTANAVDFMLARTLDSHGAFFRPFLSPGLSVLDCGCGPGSITLGIAAAVAPGGRVTGVDAGESQVAAAEANARRPRAVPAGAEVSFRRASVYELPFPEDAFDRVFSHALMEHLARPVDAGREFARVLAPGGYAGLCAPDWGGFILAPAPPEAAAAAEAYQEMMVANGGDPRAGRRLGGYLEAAGFNDVQQSARYECYPSAAVIAEYLALQLRAAGQGDHADALVNWSRHPSALFAQAWVSAVGRVG